MNAPKLRFKEFNDEWKFDKISNLTTYVDYRGKTPTKTETGIFLVTAKNVKKGYIDYNCSKEYVETSQYNDIMHKGLPQIGDVLITTEAPCGNVAQIDNINVALAQRIIKYRGKELINNTFLKYELLSDYFQKELRKVTSGGTVSGVKGSVLHQMNINYCSKDEQIKISNFLSLLDKKIELQSRKIEDLKLFKKGLISVLKKNSLDWHTVCIKDIFKITRGIVISKNELSKVKSNEYRYPVYSSQTSNQGILGYSDTFDFSGKYLTWTTDGANAGKVFYRNGEFRCTNVCGILYEDKVRFTNELFAELLNYETPKHVSYVGNPKLMNNVMANIKIKIPSEDIQDNISLVISKINRNVKLENNKLLKLQELKKGLLQCMFM